MQLMLSTNASDNHRYNHWGGHHDATIDTIYPWGGISALVAAQSPDDFVRNVGYFVTTYFKQFFITRTAVQYEVQ